MTPLEPLASFFSFAFGLILGSFFNVLIYRLPLEMSIVRPGSSCPQCGRKIRPWENIPLVSYIALRGKCAGCKRTISPLYPSVELATGLAALALWRIYVSPMSLTVDSPWQIIVIVGTGLMLLTLIPLSIIDMKHYIIPDLFTMPGLVLAIAVSFLPGGVTPIGCALGIAAGGGSLFGAGLIGKYILKKDEVMGGGDIRLMAFAGALCGWEIAIGAIFIASFLGSIAGIAFLLARREKNDRRIPFGPFLACGLWAAVLAIDKLIAAYCQWIDRMVSS